MHGYTNGARSITDAAVYGLSDPPGGVRGELEALPTVELVGRPHKSDVPVLDAVGELDPAQVVVGTLGDRNDETKVCADQLGMSAAARQDLRLQTSQLTHRKWILAEPVDLFLRCSAVRDQRPQLDLALGVDQRVSPDSTEILTDQVSVKLVALRSGSSRGYSASVRKINASLFEKFEKIAVLHR
jgi:hypothetical protein